MKKFLILILLLSCVFAQVCCASSYTVSFDTDGGTSIQSQSIPQGGFVERPENPIKDGFDFVGWFVGEEKFDFNLPITTNLTLTAKWLEIPKEFTVRFETIDGQLISENKVLKGEFINPPKFEMPSGVEFLGWYLSGKLFDFNTPITQSLTIKALFKEVIPAFVVTFSPENGERDFSYTVDLNGYVETPSIPQKEGFKFVGWFNGEVEFDFSNPITGNLTLIARWEQIDVRVFSITFFSDGKVISSYTVSGGEKVSPPINPHKEGYLFNGWQLNGEPYDFNTSIQCDVILIASWSKIEEVIEYFTINYVDEQTILYTEQVESGGILVPYVPQIKDGFIFSGWQADGVYFDFTLPIESDLTLTAVWTEIVKPYYTVDFVVGFDLFVESQQIEEGLFAIEPTLPSVEGYEFIGWLSDGKQFDFSTPITQDIVIVASWVKSYPFSSVVGKWSGVEKSSLSDQIVEIIINNDNSCVISYGKSTDELASFEATSVNYSKNVLTVKFNVKGREKIIDLIYDGESLSTAYGLFGGELTLFKT